VSRRVILIGGASSVGKTTVARALSERLRVPHVELDAILDDRDPRLNPLGGPIEIWDRPPEGLCALLVSAAEAATPLIEPQVRERASAGGAVIEGERIHPTLIARMQAAGLATGVLIIEADGERLHQTLMARSRGFHRLPEARRRAVAEVDRRYGAWLAAEAARRGLPAVTSQPWETLPDRCLRVGRTT
jgi:2-phosphoglycerate kinase